MWCCPPVTEFLSLSIQEARFSKKTKLKFRGVGIRKFSELAFLYNLSPDSLCTYSFSREVFH